MGGIRHSWISHILNHLDLVLQQKMWHAHVTANLWHPMTISCWWKWGEWNQWMNGFAEMFRHTKHGGLCKPKVAYEWGGYPPPASYFDVQQDMKLIFSVSININEQFLVMPPIPKQLSKDLGWRCFEALTSSQSSTSGQHEEMEKTEDFDGLRIVVGHLGWE